MATTTTTVDEMAERIEAALPFGLNADEQAALRAQISAARPCDETTEAIILARVRANADAVEGREQRR